MTPQSRQNLTAALGFAHLWPRASELRLLHRWLDTWRGVGAPTRWSPAAQQKRESKGMTQRDLAAKAKVTAGYIAQIEMGTKKNPSLDVLKRIAKALGVPVTELLE